MRLLSHSHNARVQSFQDLPGLLIEVHDPKSSLQAQTLAPTLLCSVYCERKVLLSGWWLVWCERKTLLAGYSEHSAKPSNSSLSYPFKCSVQYLAARTEAVNESDLDVR